MRPLVDTGNKRKFASRKAKCYPSHHDVYGWCYLDAAVTAIRQESPPIQRSSTLTGSLRFSPCACSRILFILVEVEIIMAHHHIHVCRSFSPYQTIVFHPPHLSQGGGDKRSDGPYRPNDAACSHGSLIGHHPPHRGGRQWPPASSPPRTA